MRPVASSFFSAAPTCLPAPPGASARPFLPFSPGPGSPLFQPPGCPSQGSPEKGPELSLASVHVPLESIKPSRCWRLGVGGGAHKVQQGGGRAGRSAHAQSEGTASFSATACCRRVPSEGLAQALPQTPAGSASPSSAAVGAPGLLGLLRFSRLLYPRARCLLTGSALPVTAYDKNGFRILFHFAKECPPGRPDVLVVVVSMLNTAPLPIKSIVLQAAVPKVRPGASTCRRSLCLQRSVEGVTGQQVAVCPLATLGSLSAHHLFPFVVNESEAAATVWDRTVSV